MNDRKAIEFFVTSSIGAARALPLNEARLYLKGLLLVGGEHPALDALRQVYSDFCAIDDQLTLLQIQLPFQLAEDAKS